MKISRPSLGQFYLVTGEWIVAQILENDENHYLVDHAVLIKDLEEDDDFENEMEGKQYYIMRPFLKYTDNLETSCAINPISIVSLSTPSDNLIDQYLQSCQTMQEVLGNGDQPEPITNTGNIVTFKPRD